MGHAAASCTRTLRALVHSKASDDLRSSSPLPALTCSSPPSGGIPSGTTRMARLDHADDPSTSSPEPKTGRVSLWEDAVERYKEDHGVDLLQVDGLPRLLMNAASDREILKLLQDTEQDFQRARKGHAHWQKIREALKHIVRVVTLFSASAAGEVSVPGGRIVFAAVGILFQATRKVSEYLDGVADLFEELRRFLDRVDAREGVPYKEGSRAIALDILAHLLDVLSIATDVIRRRRSFRARLFVKMLVSEPDIQDKLRKLQKLTDYELRMDVVENLSFTHQVARTQGEILETLRELCRRNDRTLTHFQAQHSDLL